MAHMTTQEHPPSVKRVRAIRHDLQNLAEDYRTAKIDIELQHTKALKKLASDHAERSRSLQHRIESIAGPIAS
jgi:hypothetical protein